MTNLPAVQQASAAILRKLELVKLEQPNLTPHQQMLEARRRCQGGILAANAAINRLELTAPRNRHQQPASGPRRERRHSRCPLPHGR
jgi:hypothetical protein